jgi:hypothetical protein
LILSLAIIRIIPVQASPGLNLTVKTGLQYYYNGQLVEIYGNLTLDDVLITDGLVGLQIQTPADQLLIIRTLPAWHGLSETPYVFLEYVVPCDSNGNPKYSFRRGTLGYFILSAANLDIEPRDVLMTINVYDNASTPFGFASIQTVLAPQSFPQFLISIPISSEAVLGTATAYGNAYTNWPKLGGTPYCNEVRTAFQITSTMIASDQATSTQNPISTILTTETSNYNTTFKLARDALRGNYTIYATSRYQGEPTFNSTTFSIPRILGDLGSGVPPTFFAFDGKVDGKDMSLFLLCFKNQAPPEAMYLADLGGGFPPDFFDFDGVVNGKDLSLFLVCFKGLGP